MRLRGRERQAQAMMTSAKFPNRLMTPISRDEGERERGRKGMREGMNWKREKRIVIPTPLEVGGGFTRLSSRGVLAIDGRKIQVVCKPLLVPP